MPTLPERMASLETEVATIKETTIETKTDVKALLAWRDEERGARRQRALSVKYIGIGLTILTIVLNVAFKFV